MRAEKHALLIAIGNYNQGDGGWPNLDVALDVKLMRAALEKQGFLPNNIIVLRDKEAVKEGILTKFDELGQRLKPDDIVFIHFSGHGQQISDTNGDEGDGWDEALCPYDSRPRFGKEYHGACHITDDEVQQLLKALCSRVGAKGEVVYAVDACHSGAGVRGPIMRGTDSGFVIPPYQEGTDSNKRHLDNNFLEQEIPANLVAFFGAAAGQANYQIWYNTGVQMGSLSYALSMALMEVTEHSTYEDLANKVYRIVQKKCPVSQHPSTAGYLQRRVFHGDVNAPAHHFKVLQVLKPNVVLVNASLLDGVDAGSVLAFCAPDGEFSDSPENLITGKVVVSDYGWCKVKLYNAAPAKDLYEAHVFVQQRHFKLRPLEVGISSSNSELAKRIALVLAEFDTLVHMNSERPYVLFSDASEPAGLEPKHLVSAAHYVRLSTEGSMEERVRDTIIDHLMAQYLLSLKGNNPLFRAEVALIDPATGDPYPREDGMIQVRENESFLIEISNTGEQPFFFNVLYVQSDGLVGPLEPSIEDKHLEPVECFVKPFDVLRAEYKYRAVKPLGKDVFVVLLTNKEFHAWRGLSDLRAALLGARGVETRAFDLSQSANGSVLQVVIHVKE